MKTQLKLLLLPALALTLSFGGCYSDNEEDLYLGSSTCDLTNVTYSTTVAPIFAAYCNSCHNSNNLSGNIATDSYTAVVANMSRIKGAINHTSGYSPMPQNGNKLSDCELSKIDTWITQGMPNN